MQQKDVLYIDVEDDITAIIGKVKASKNKIVALVPPKRTGVLQSAVNLRLLARTADNEDKHLVLITGNAALTHLAAAAKIPVAKNLQSRPEVAEIKNFDNDDEEDVIDGEQLPIGDHAKMPVSDDDEEVIVPPTTIDDLEIDDKPKRVAATSKVKKGIKVPDFGSFRKKMVFGIGGGILLIAFLVWAIVIAPHATVVISAKTQSVSIKTPLTIGDSLANDSAKATLASSTQTDKVTSETDVTPTGKKDVGTKASGTVVFYNNCYDTSSPVSVSAGTYLSGGGNNYVTQSAVMIPASSKSHGQCNPGVSSPVSVAAADVGDAYNTAAGASFAVAGYDSDIKAASSNGITGGEKHQAKVVTVEDLQSALDSLKQKDTDSEKKKLAAKFGKDITVITDSFTAETGTPNLTPSLGQEVTGDKAKLSLEVTYTLTGIPKAALDSYLKDAISKQISTNSQRIYETGASSAQLTEFQAGEDKNPATVQLSATGQVGPKIDDDKIKDEIKGKRTGEVQGDLRAIDGVSDVDVKLSPFWVSGIPGDTKKITIEFKLLKNNG